MIVVDQQEIRAGDQIDFHYVRDVCGRPTYETVCGRVHSVFSTYGANYFMVAVAKRNECGIGGYKDVFEASNVVRDTLTLIRKERTDG